MLLLKAPAEPPYKRAAPTTFLILDMPRQLLQGRGQSQMMRGLYLTARCNFWHVLFALRRPFEKKSARSDDSETKRGFFANLTDPQGGTTARDAESCAAGASWYPPYRHAGVA
jgi:hypothetical protein